MRLAFVDYVDRFDWRTCSYTTLQCIPIITGFGTFGVPHSVPIISHHHHLDHSYPLLSTLHLLMKVLTHLVFFCQNDIFSCCARRVKINKLLYFWRSLKGSSSSVWANFCYSLENTAFANQLTMAWLFAFF